jgi:uncharacterized protein Smg (DUF494 family)
MADRMMRNRILEIVVFLIDFMQGNKGRLSGSDELSTVLEAEGYSEDEISTAYSWLLQRFDNAPEQYFSEIPTMNASSRVLTPNERMQLTAEAQGYLIKLLNLSLIDHEQFESILERAAVFGPKSVSLDQLKLIASSVVLSGIDEMDDIDLSDASVEHSLHIN